MITTTPVARYEIVTIPRRGRAYIGVRRGVGHIFNIDIVESGDKVLCPTYRIEVTGSTEEEAAANLVAEEERDYNQLLRIILHDFPDATEDMIEFRKFVKQEPKAVSTTNGVKASTEFAIVAFA